jgi:hypothetical protein
LFIKAKGEIKLKIARQLGREFERNETMIRALTRFAIDNKIDVIIVDPLVKTHGVHENDNEAIQAVIECYDDIAEAANCGIEIKHHTRKAGGNEVTIESARGGGALVDALRSVQVQEKMSKADAEKLKVQDYHDRYFREFSGKRNFAPPISESTWYRLANIEVDNGRDVVDGKRVGGDQVGVVEPWTYPQARSVNLSPETIEAIKQKVGTKPRYKEHALADMWVGKPVAEVLGLDPEDDKEAIKAVVKRLMAMKALRRQAGMDKVRREPKTFVVAGEGPIDQN